MTLLNERDITNLLGMIGRATVMVVTLRPVGSTEEYDVVVSQNDAILAEALIQASYDGTIENNGIQHHLVKVGIGTRESAFSNPEIIQSWDFGQQAKPKMNEAIERDQQYQEAVGEAVALVKELCGDLQFKISADVEDKDEIIRKALFKFLANEDPRNSLEIAIFHDVGPYRNLLSRLI